MTATSGLTTWGVVSGLRYAKTWLLTLLLLASICSLTSSAALAKRDSRPVNQGTTEYTDPQQFLHTRVRKLQAIIERAQRVQQSLKPTLQGHQRPQARQTYAKWQHIERQARNMLLELQKNLTNLDGRAGLNTSGPLAKNVRLTRLDGKREKIADYRGDVVLMHFWATWCRPCIKEIDSLQQLYQDFRDQKLSVVPISLDARKKDVNRFMRKKHSSCLCILIHPAPCTRT